MNEIVFEWNGGWVEVSGGWLTVAASICVLLAIAVLGVLVFGSPHRDD
jgi:hypothetical protein